MKVQDTTLVDDLASMLEDQLFCDVTFIVENTRIPAHKAVLAARCERFKAMFTSQLMESNSSEITIQDTKADVFRSKLFSLGSFADINFNSAHTVYLLRPSGAHRKNSH